jgi:hypothetical protein
MKLRIWAVLIYRGHKHPPAKLGVIRHRGENPEDLARAMYGRKAGMYLLLISEK